MPLARSEPINTGAVVVWALWRRSTDEQVPNTDAPAIGTDADSSPKGWIRNSEKVRVVASPNERLSFYIALHKDYWTFDGNWIGEPDRHADAHVFAWHREDDVPLADHRVGPAYVCPVILFDTYVVDTLNRLF